MPTPTPETRRRLGISDLEARLRMHRHTIERWYNAGKLVQPHYFGRYRRWWLDEIEEWERKTQRETVLNAPSGSEPTQ